MTCDQGDLAPSVGGREADYRTMQPNENKKKENTGEEAAKLRLQDEFETNGFLCLKNTIPLDCIRQLNGAAQMHARQIFQIMRDNGLLSSNTQQHCAMSIPCGVKHGFREIVFRSPGRYEMSVQNRHWNTHTTKEAAVVLQNDHPSSSFQQQLENISSLSKQVHLSLLESPSGQKLISLAKSLLQVDQNDDVYICNISIVVAEPGACEQSWHADGGHLTLGRHLPCHCLNVFLPLVDITEELGPTELRPGSHYLTRNLAPMMLAAKARKELRSPCLPLLSAGDALIFDYRILHRGKENMSTTTNRPILVITLAKKTFGDLLNFPHKSILDIR
mmetsp:Transcript_24192/g.34665  ORF Transcript_24192/g.34665 Transcript_24192/m.34665 type:complete len:332 (-) Transcript_24192:166-1161(-)|eukprot:CAMPEP_0172430138 /NCGR_PEP_ID=MMETSP1064-20121228/53246_1 /TAXON_ID=202472 /ORGANISM="Aulacoseira subarctica , Strain CCAP 1002/5" /LENGTH=331 /DNA_ID=CAMNT_0013175995 /DNA_START=197 /DNA_END=1192 /DNA_ORIENTATION=-